MGTHAGYFIKTEEGKPYITLYQHYDGYDWKLSLASALAKAKSRISMTDISYATRIIISQLIGDTWDSELGFGLYLEDGANPNLSDYEYSCVIDLVNMQVQDFREDTWISLDTFIQLYNPVTV